MRNICNVHNNIFLNHENRPLYIYYQTGGTQFRRMHFDGFRYLPYIGMGGGHAHFIDSYIQNKWYKQIPGLYAGYTDTFGVVDGNDYLGNSGVDGRADYTRNPGFGMYSDYIDWNFEEGLHGIVEAANLIWQRGVGKEWSLINLRSEFYLACQSHVYVPPNTAVTVKGEFKGQSNGSWSKPYLVAKKLSNAHLGKYELNDSSTFSVSSDADVKNSNIYGFLQQVIFTSSSEGAWEQKTLNIDAQKYGYRLVAGYRIDSDNQEEVGYVKDITVILPKTPTSKSKHFDTKTQIGTGKKRISGRI
jgi:hypothetical protein